MALNMSTLVYLPSQDIFGRRVEFYPAGGASFMARGIFGTQPFDIAAEDGSIISSQQTILDIRDAEFTTMPRQLDRLFIPAERNIPAEGLFDIADLGANGGGETTLILRSVGPDRP